MKGFSRKETQQYYRTIIEKAWKQVETAETPEVKSEAYDKNLEWTMLDKEYDNRTREVFRTGPVFVPTWWGRYDPTFNQPVSTSKPISQPSLGGSSQPGGGGDFTSYSPWSLIRSFGCQWRSKLFSRCNWECH